MRVWLLVAMLSLAVGAQLPVGRALVAGARGCVGDRYDAGYYAGGPPPRGRGACTDVVYYAYRALGKDLQELVDRDLQRHPTLYPLRRDRNIDYRWCPNLLVWFTRHVRRAPKGDFQAGDIVFWSLTNDGVADHVGVVSDRRVGGRPLVIHNFPPGCREEDVLGRWTVLGNFRPG